MEPGGDLRPLPGGRIVDPEIAAGGQRGHGRAEFIAEIEPVGAARPKEIFRRDEVADQHAVLHIGDAVVLDGVAHFADALAAVLQIGVQA